MNTATQTAPEVATPAAPKTKPEASKAKPKTVNFRELAESKRDLVYLDPKIIQIKDDFNIRQDYGDMAELKRSIAENGVLKPLEVFQEGGIVFVIDGHRRLTAVKTLIKDGLEMGPVPCIPEEKGTTEEDRIFRMLISGSGLPLTVMEQATAVERLTNLGMTPQSIAKQLGRTQATISNLKALVSMPNEIKREIESGTISASTAIAVNRECKGDKEKVKEVIAKAKEVAGTTGKKKVTSKSLKGETKRNNKKDTKNRIVALLDQAIKAFRGTNEEEQMAAIEALQIYRDSLATAK